MDTVLSSKTKPVTIGSDRPFCIIGERITPTSRKKFSEELREGNLDTVVVDTKAQVEAGADMLDVNAGIPLVDEAELLAKMLTLIQETTDLPICIDSSVIEALEAGLGGYEGKALVNSVTGEDERLGGNLPLGASNVSFGLPERHVLNAGFLPMAMAAGLTSAIMSTAKVCVDSVRAADLLLGHDAWGARWIAAHRARKAEAVTAT